MNIRALVFIFLFLLAGFSAGAQDIIQKHNGETIEALVIDISPGVIKYRKFSQPNGPVFSIAREQVDRIMYESGKTVTFESEEKTTRPVDQDPAIAHVKPSPTFGWHLGVGGSDLYGDISGNKMQLASAIGATFSLPVGKNNTILLGVDILSLGCRFEDIDITYDDGSRIVITNSNEDLGYLSVLAMDRFFLNGNRNYYIEGGGYGSFLMNAATSGEAEITDTNGVVTSGTFNEKIFEYYKPYDFGLAVGVGGRVPLDKNKKWHLTAGARFYYGLTNIIDDSFVTGLDGYRESNIFGLIFIGVDIPTKSKQ